jgi:hypothetical protein
MCGNGKGDLPETKMIRHPTSIGFRQAIEQSGWSHKRKIYRQSGLTRGRYTDSPVSLEEDIQTVRSHKRKIYVQTVRSH